MQGGCLPDKQIFYRASNYAMVSKKKQENVSVYKGLQKTALCLAADAGSHTTVLRKDSVWLVVSTLVLRVETKC